MGNALLSAVSLALAAVAEPPPEWVEVETAHFRIKTDLNPESAMRAAVLTERSRAALLAAAWPRFKLVDDRLALVVFSNRRDFQRYFGESAQAQAVLGSHVPTLYLFGDPESWEKSVARSEAYTSVLMQALARYFTSIFYGGQPRWFATGLVEFLATVHVSQDGRSATVGHRNYGAYDNYRTYRQATVADALAWGTTLEPSDEPTLLSLTGLSWLMVAWMYSTHHSEFVRFQALLGTSLDPRRAWETVFPKMSPGELDGELRRSSEPFVVNSVVISEADGPIGRARPLTAAEIQALHVGAAVAGGRTPPMGSGGGATPQPSPQ